MNNNTDAPKGSPLEGSRLQGILIIIIGLVAGYFSIYLPLKQAQEHAQEISYAGHFAFLSPPLILLGVLAFIFPSMTTDNTFLLKSKGKLSVAGWMLVLALVVLGGATFFFVNHQLSLMGYVDK
jgi:hypothetical protein